MDTYAIYLRKSRMDLDAEASGQGETLARHEAALTALAIQRRLPIGRIYREVVSGDSISGRPEMQQLLSDVEAGLYRGVLCMEESRLARGDTMDQGLVSRAFSYSHTLIITPARTFDPDNEADEEYFEFGLFMARREYKMIRRRLYRGRVASAQEGKAGGGRPPFGYRKVKLVGAKGYTYEIVPEEAAIVRDIFDRYLLHDTPIMAIAKQLNDSGIPAPRSSEWTPTTIKTILDNPTYAGYIRCGIYKSDKKPSGERSYRRETEEVGKTLFKGLHPAIITEEEHAQVMSVRRIHAKGRTGPKKELSNQLAGLAYCSNCGRLLGTSMCRGVRRLYCKTYGCTTGTVVLRKVESLMMDAIQEHLDALQIPDGTPDTSDAEMQILSDLRRTEKELATVAGQIDRSFDLLEQGVYTSEIFAARLEKLNQRQTTITQTRDRLQAQIDQLQQMKPDPQAVEKIRRVTELYPSLHSAQAKNDLLRTVLTGFVVNHPVRTDVIGVTIVWRV